MFTCTSLRVLPPASLVASSCSAVLLFNTDKVAGQVTGDDETVVADEMQTQAVKARQRLHRIGAVPPAEPERGGFTCRRGKPETRDHSRGRILATLLVERTLHPGGWSALRSGHSQATCEMSPDPMIGFFFSLHFAYRITPEERQPGVQHSVPAEATTACGPRCPKEAIMETTPTWRDQDHRL